MSDVCAVTLVGRLVRDPEMRYAASGCAVGSFTLAANHRYRDKAGQWHEEPAFVPCVAFSRTAERLADQKKGARLLVIGRLRTEQWEKEGEKHSRLVLVADTAETIAPLAGRTEEDTGGDSDVPF